jgi:plastocyanin
MAFTVLSCSGDDNLTGPGGGEGTGADVTISIVGQAGANSYSANPETLTVGQTVAWKNNDGTTAHSATSNDGTTFDTGLISSGATSAKRTMSTAGSFPYHCTPHPAMTGTLVVIP